MSGYSPFQPWSAVSPYGLALGLAAAVCVVLALAGWARRRRPGGVYFVSLALLAMAWALLYSWQLTTPSLEGKVFWLKLEHVAIAGVPLAFFLFARDYSGALRKLDRRVLVLLCAVPLLSSLLVVTNEMHLLEWESVALSPAGTVPAVQFEPGPWYWINTIYDYVLMAVGSFLLMRMALRSPRIYRVQAVLLVAGAVVPWIGDALWVLMFREEWLDVTPFVFVFSGVLFLLAMSRWSLFELHPVLVPLARMQLVETMPDGVLVVDTQGNVAVANPAAQSIFGREEKGLQGAPVTEVLGERAGVRDALARSDARFLFSLGEGSAERHFDVMSSSLQMRGGGAGSLLVFRDITEQRGSEIALRTSEERFRAVFEQGSVGMAVFDTAQRFVRVNGAMCRMLGYEEDDLMGMTITQITAPSDREITADLIAPLLSGSGSLLQVDKQYLRKDGTAFWGHVSAASLRSPDGRPMGTIAVVQDISERKAAEGALETSLLQLEAAMDLADLVTWELDGRAGLFRFDDRFYALYGTTAEAQGGYYMPAGVYIEKFVHPDDADFVQGVIEKSLLSGDVDERFHVEHRIVRSDGEIRNVVVRYGIVKDQNGVTIGTRGANQDVTERVRTEQALALAQEQLRQSQKMEAVGQLAGGIAHDFNNLLTAIIGNSDLALQSMSADDANRPFVDDIRTVGERAAGLTKQILAFSRRQMLKPEVVCLNDTVRGMEPLLHRTLTENVHIKTRLDPELLCVEVDPHQMEQVLMNLAVNGRDAMPEGGRLTISTANVELDAGYCATHSEVDPGAYVLLAVSDTGIGMDAALQERAFEPFFTTKEMGKGTGLGLSTVFGIVRQSGGSVAIKSKVGKGTTFEVFLPASRSAEIGGADRGSAQAATKGHETIMVVEDERSVRELVVRMLTRAGYATLEAGSAAEADALLLARPPALDLLITDMVLSGKRGGRDVAAAVRAALGGVPVIFMSGYTEDMAVFDGSDAESAGFLAKPFAAHALLAAVREALDSRAGTGRRTRVKPRV